MIELDSIEPMDYSIALALTLKDLTALIENLSDCRQKKELEKALQEAKEKKEYYEQVADW